MSVNSIGGGRHMGRMFNNFDTNGDGQLSRDEMTKFAQGMPANGGQGPSVDELMTRLDTDGDGQVSQAEMKAGRPRRGPPPDMYGGQGTAPAGGLDSSQLEAMAERFSQRSGQSVSADDLLAAFDSDGDGAVSAEEMQAGRQSLKAQLNAGMQNAFMRRR